MKEEEVRQILTSHKHFDHCGNLTGQSEVKKTTINSKSVVLFNVNY